MHAASRHRPTLLVMAGVSGSGKSSVGRRVADRLGWPFLDGDSLHSPANIAKMRADQPLDDADRLPWLDAISRWMDARQAEGTSAVIACSALKQRYRDRLRHGHPDVQFIWLKVDRAELARRLDQRTGHFMPAALLASQLAAWEPPAPDEPVMTIPANGDLEATVRAVLAVARTV